MASIDLIQPRHNYAPAFEKERYGHIYLPTSLHTAAARMSYAGVDVKIHDENLRVADITASSIGVNLLGAPYIPEIIKLQSRIRKDTCENITWVVGGQVVQPSVYGLSSAQVQELFGQNTINGNDDGALSKLLNIDERSLKRAESTSLVPIYEQIDDADMFEYLSREFSFYVSQGCSQKCVFCAALKGIPERYRETDVMKKDLNYLAQRAAKLGIEELKIYMSNLDVAQNPWKLDQFTAIVKEVREQNPGIKILLRGLATVPFFNKYKEKYRDVFKKLVEAGFHRIGFGVDGWDDDLWKELKKGNTKDDCIEAIRSAREDFGMTPEILMVFGHDLGESKRDTPESLDGAYAICLEMAEKYGAIPRPHISKSFIPGNAGWIAPEHALQVNQLIQHPEAFQCLDFTALPSKLTHPDAKIRKLATEYYLKICAIKGSITQHTRPITPDMSPEEIQEVQNYNEGRYDQ